MRPWQSVPANPEGGGAAGRTDHRNRHEAPHPGRFIRAKTWTRWACPSPAPLTSLAYAGRVSPISSARKPPFARDGAQTMPPAWRYTLLRLQAWYDSQKMCARPGDARTRSQTPQAGQAAGAQPSVPLCPLQRYLAPLERHSSPVAVASSARSLASASARAVRSCRPKIMTSTDAGGSLCGTGRIPSARRSASSRRFSCSS